MTARKGISLLLSLTLVFSAILTVLPAPAFAAENASEISLDAGVIAKNDTVWFGPVQWRVLSPSTDATLPVSGTGNVLLIPNHLMQDSGVYFKKDDSSNQWAGSDAQAWCTNLYNGWPEKEKAAVKATSVTETNDKTSADGTYFYLGGYYNNKYYSAASLNAEHFFFLSAQEADTYFNNDADRRGYSEYLTRFRWWWLRSPLAGSVNRAGNVDSDGWVTDAYVDAGIGARPAFNLNLPSVLFVSAAEGGKSIAAESGESSGAEGAGVYKIPSGSKTEWKLTLKNSSRSGFTSSATSLSGAPGGIINIPYSGAKTDTNEYVSILICDKTEVAQYYGSYKISAASGTADFVLPSGLSMGNYTVKLFNEQRNGSHESDYASDFVSIPLKVGKPVLTITANNKTYKYNGQNQGPGDIAYEDPTEIAELFTVTGLQGSDTLTSVILDGQGKDVGDYDLVPSNAVVGNASGSYDIRYVNGTLTVDPRTVTVTARDQTIDEGESILSGTEWADLAGAVSGHSLSAVTLTAADGRIVPSAAKIQNAAEEDVTKNYDISYQPGILTLRRKISQTVTFKVVNGSWDDGTTEDKTVTLSGLEGDTLKLAANQIPAVGSKPADTYKTGGWDVTPSTETEITGNTTYTYTYAAKDSISRTVTFKVVNGSWNDGTTEDQTVTLSGLEGDTLKLAENQIPAVGSKPADTYKAGGWDATPSTEAEITGNTTYTYTYEAVISYTTTSGDGQEYRINSNGDLIFTIKRSINDDLTFGSFLRSALDGQILGTGDYETAQGSLIFTLKASKVNTLALGTHTLTFTFSDGTASAAFIVKPVAGSFEDVAVPSDSFTFKKVWEGGNESSIDFTLYKLGDTVYHHGFDKRIISKTEWQYNAWFSSPVACYVIEEPVAGYKTRYENVGIYAGITDRCCDGGTIVNYRVPKTGDDANLSLWLGCVLAGLTIISITVYAGKRKKAHCK